MESDIINDDRIYYLLWEDFIVFSRHDNVRYDYFRELYNRFLENKQLGIIFIGRNHHEPYDSYRIVDEKKWMLTRIKYGI